LAAFLGGTESESYASIFGILVLIPLVPSRLWGIDDDSESDEGEEHFQEGYEESFIDDDEGAGDDLGLHIGPLTPPSDNGDEEDEEEEVVELDSTAVVRQRNGQAPIVISSDEEDEEYTDADTHGDYGQFWSEGVDEGGYHDARSDSDNHGEMDYGSDDGYSFYGYL